VTTSAPLDRHLERILAGERLPAAVLAELAGSHDILALGMLADALRRRMHGTTTTFLRVARCAASTPWEIPAAAREVRVTGNPAGLDAALAAVTAAVAAAGGRPVAGFSWPVIEQLAAGAPGGIGAVLSALRRAGLEAVAAVPLDSMPDPRAAIDALGSAGFRALRLTIERGGGDRLSWLLQAASLHEEFGLVQTLNPLPSGARGEPSTGYDDVRSVALARLAAPGIPSIQVDWERYGPKLAQVALTFGADDLDGVSASDEAPDGRRRAPLVEVRRNIEAAGFAPQERDGRFAPIG
jgi:hypothetical protein